MKIKTRDFFSIYTNPKILAILCLGFSSGLPLALTASTLAIWLTESGTDMHTIGLFASVTMPYALKFLWSPLIDSLPFPVLSRLLGRRRGWLVATQLLLMAGIASMALIDPAQNAWLMALAALMVTIFSASQDIVIDAYRVEILPPEQYGAGAASVVMGYRFGMIAATAGALHLASYAGWHTTYIVMALLMLVGIATALLAGEPHPVSKVQEDGVTNGHWFHDSVIAPFADFMKREDWLMILLFILLYKFADAFMGTMTGSFLIKIGFSKNDIADVLKLYGMIATIAGGFLGGWLVARIGMIRTLWLCGIAHMATNLLMAAQAHIGPDIHFLTLTIISENLSGGMGTAAFVAFMSSLTHVRFTATQYALLSSLSVVGRTGLSTRAGYLQEAVGWENFFLFATLLALPGLVVLWWLSRKTSMAAQEI